MSISGVIFDWGGVLIDDPSPGIAAYMANKLGRSVDDPVPFEALDAFQKGKISELDFFEACDVPVEQARNGGRSLWREAFDEVYREKTFVFDWIEKLRASSVKIGFLSNTEMPAVKMFKEKGYQCFDELVFSCVCGMAKPDLAIYELALGRMKTPASETLFIDDKIENIEAAKSVGLLTHRMTDEFALESRAKELGLPF